MVPLSHDELSQLAPVVFVTGKGGVGKTTVAAMLALEAAARNQRAVLVEFGDGEAGRRTLGSNSQVGHAIVVFDEAIVEAVTELLGSALLAKVFVGHSAIRRLLRVAPGVAELIKLDGVRRLSLSGKWDRIVVDLPASGHAIGWLRVAAAIQRFARTGPFFQLAQAVDQMVRDTARSAIVVVTVAEALIVRETVELCAALQKELGRPADLVAINRVPDLIDGAEATLAAVRALGQEVPNLDTRFLDELITSKQLAAKEARAAVAEASSIASHSIVEVPDLPTDPEPADMLHWIAGFAERKQACRA